MTTDVMNSKAYLTFLNDIKKDIQTSRVRAALSVNKELILLYFPWVGYIPSSLDGIALAG
jgi:hypothetical protein